MLSKTSSDDVGERKAEARKPLQEREGEAELGSWLERQVSIVTSASLQSEIFR